MENTRKKASAHQESWRCMAGITFRVSTRGRASDICFAFPILHIWYYIMLYNSILLQEWVPWSPLGPIPNKNQESGLWKTLIFLRIFKEISNWYDFNYFLKDFNDFLQEFIDVRKDFVDFLKDYTDFFKDSIHFVKDSKDFLKDFIDVLKEFIDVLKDFWNSIRIS